MGLTFNNMPSKIKKRQATIEVYIRVKSTNGYLIHLFCFGFYQETQLGIRDLRSAPSDLPNHDENDHKINQDSHDQRCRRSGHECWPLQICTSELKSYVYRSELKCTMKIFGKDFIWKLHTNSILNNSPKTWHFNFSYHNFYNIKKM